MRALAGSPYRTSVERFFGSTVVRVKGLMELSMRLSYDVNRNWPKGNAYSRPGSRKEPVPRRRSDSGYATLTLALLHLCHKRRLFR